jgi:hypothetical protein
VFCIRRSVRLYLFGTGLQLLRQVPGDSFDSGQIELGDEQEGHGVNLKIPTAQAGELVVLEVCAIVHRARGQSG